MLLSPPHLSHSYLFHAEMQFTRMQTYSSFGVCRLLKTVSNVHFPYNNLNELIWLWLCMDFEPCSRRNCKNDNVNWWLRIIFQCVKDSIRRVDIIILHHSNSFEPYLNWQFRLAVVFNEWVVPSQIAQLLDKLKLLISL